MNAQQLKIAIRNVIMQREAGQGNPLEAHLRGFSSGKGAPRISSCSNRLAT